MSELDCDDDDRAARASSSGQSRVRDGDGQSEFSKHVGSLTDRFTQGGLSRRAAEPPPGSITSCSSRRSVWPTSTRLSSWRRRGSHGLPLVRAEANDPGGGGGAAGIDRCSGFVTVDREYGSGGPEIAAGAGRPPGVDPLGRAADAGDRAARRVRSAAVKGREERKDPLYYRLLKSFLRGSFEGT